MPSKTFFHELEKINKNSKYDDGYSEEEIQAKVLSRQVVVVSTWRTMVSNNEPIKAALGKRAERIAEDLSKQKKKMEEAAKGGGNVLSEEEDDYREEGLDEGDDEGLDDGLGKRKRGRGRGLGRGAPRNAARRSDLGPLGVESLGNTCFLSAVVQCLHRQMPRDMSWLDESAFDKVSHKVTDERKTPDKTQLVRAFADLFRLLNTGKTISQHSVSPMEFVLAFAKVHPEFFVRAGKGGAFPVKQMDMQEVLSALVCLLHDVLGGSIITDMYEGMERDLLTCKLCKEHNTAYKPHTVTPAPFICLSLPIPGPDTIELSALVDDYTTQNEQTWTCPQKNCAGGGEAKENECDTVFETLPNLLIVHLKRFELIGEHLHRSDTLVHFDAVTPLQLPQHMGPGADDVNVAYDLVAVGNHIPASSANMKMRNNKIAKPTIKYLTGHYTALIRRGETNMFYVCDDAKVTLIDGNNVCTPNAYVLFYRRRHPRYFAAGGNYK